LIRIPENVDSKYRFVILSALRARQLQGGSMPLIKEPSHKATQLARKELQQRLKVMEYDPGAINGNFTDKTRKAIGAWQKKNDVTETGLLGQAQQHDGILAAGEEQHRVGAFTGDFAQDGDGFGFQPVEVRTRCGGGCMGRFQHGAHALTPAAARTSRPSGPT